MSLDTWSDVMGMVLDKGDFHTAEQRKNILRHVVAMGDRFVPEKSLKVIASCHKHISLQSWFSSDSTYVGWCINLILVLTMGISSESRMSLCWGSSTVTTPTW